LEFNIIERSFNNFPSFYLSTPTLIGFTRIEVVVLKGAVPLEVGGSYLASLPPPSLGVRRTVRLHVSTLLSARSLSPVRFIEHIQEWAYVLNVGNMQDGSVVLVVQTEKERRQAVEAVGKLGDSLRSKLTVEVEA